MTPMPLSSSARTRCSSSGETLRADVGELPAPPQLFGDGLRARPRRSRQRARRARRPWPPDRRPRDGSATDRVGVDASRRGAAVAIEDVAARAPARSSVFCCWLRGPRDHLVVLEHLQVDKPGFDRRRVHDARDRPRRNEHAPNVASPVRRRRELRVARAGSAVRVHGSRNPLLACSSATGPPDVPSPATAPRRWTWREAPGRRTRSMTMCLLGLRLDQPRARWCAIVRCGCGDRSVSISSVRCRLIFFLGRAFLLQPLHQVAVPDQLEVLPRREEQHGDEQRRRCNRAPNCRCRASSTSRTIGLFRTSFLIAYSKSVAAHAEPLNRAQLARCAPAGCARLSSSPASIGRFVRIANAPPSPCASAPERVLDDAVLERVKRDRPRAAPPASSRSAAPSRNVSSPSSSRFTQIRSA